MCELVWFRNNCRRTNLASCLVSSGDVAASLTRKLNSSFAAMMLHAAKDYLAPYFTTAVPSISCKYNEWHLSHLFLYAVDMSAQADANSFNCFQKGIIYLPEGSPLFTSVLSTHHARVVFQTKMRRSWLVAFFCPVSWSDGSYFCYCIAFSKPNLTAWTASGHISNWSMKPKFNKWAVKRQTLLYRWNEVSSRACFCL